MPVPQINLDVTGTIQPFTLSSVVSAPDNQKYPTDDIKEVTPCTLLYVKGRTSMTIEVAEAIVMPGRILRGQPISSDCVMVEVTTIIEGHQFEGLDYPNEEEGVEKLKEGSFIL
jgi:hypothetical protein